MYSSGGVFKYGSALRGAGENRQAWQWQPTRTEHDPNPPITLEEPGVTVTCLNADWGADVDSTGSKGALDGDDLAGKSGGGQLWRWAQKFDVSALTGTVTKVELRIRVVNFLSAASTMDIGPYGTAGTDDPEADSGATMYSRCNNAGEYVNNSTAFNAVKTIKFDLGSQAVTDLQAALAGGIFSVSCHYNDEGAAGPTGAAIEEYNGTTPPELCVTTVATGATTLTPAAVAIPIALPAPTMVRAKTVAPDAVAIPVVAPAPVIALSYTLTPSALAVPIALPTPTVSTGAGATTLTPSPVAIPIATPAPVMARSKTVTPDPAAVPIAVPAPTIARTLTLTPSPVSIPLAVPAPTVLRSKSVTPDPVAVPIATPAPTIARTLALVPSPVAVPIVAPAPTIVVSGAPTTLTPAPVAIPLVLPDPTILHPAPGATGVKHYPKRRRRLYYGELEFEEPQPEPVQPKPPRKRPARKPTPEPVEASRSAAPAPSAPRPTRRPARVSSIVVSPAAEAAARLRRQQLDEDELLLRFIL